MKITIDTKQDSVEDIKSAIQLLYKIIEQRKSGSSPDFEINEMSPSEPSNSESANSESTGSMFNLFGDNSVSASGPAENQENDDKKESIRVETY